jgi:SAM-dependent methyltransferase/predicted nucleotidyltransferase
MNESIDMKRSSYSHKDSWIAYNKIFWNNQEEDIKKVVKNIIEKGGLNSELSPETPIKILVLGIGVGTYDLPFISQLEKEAKRQIKIVGIDLAKEPLFFTSKQIENGLDKLPYSVDDRVENIQEHNWEFTPQQNSWIVNKKHLFVCDSLDFESQANEDFHNNDITLASYPSQWKERLKEARKKLDFDDGESKFDIIQTSLCLLHLTWWRHTLVNALSLLKEEGLFLYSHLEGDVEMMEGFIPNITDRDDSTRIQNIKKIFIDILYKNEKVLEQGYHKISRPATSIRPFAINSFFDRLKYYGFKDLAKLEGNTYQEYSISNIVNAHCYYTLLANKFLSSTRIIESKVGKRKYEELLKEVKVYIDSQEKDSSPSDDNLSFIIKWSCFKLENWSEASRSPMIEKFLHSSENDSNNKCDKYKLLEREYEFSETNQEIGLRQLYEDTVSEEMVKRLTTNGIVSSACFGGAVRHASKNSSNISIFYNFLYKNSTRHDVFSVWDNFSQNMWEYLLLSTAVNTQSVNTQSFNTSNTDLLLKEVIPASDVPCIVTYQYKEDNKSDTIEDYIKISIIHHRPFKEIKVELSTKIRTEFQNIQTENTLPKKYKVNKSNKEIDRFCFICDKEEQIAQEEYSQNLIEKIKSKFPIEQMLEASKNSINGSDTEKFIDKLKQTITDDVVEKFIIFSCFSYTNKKIDLNPFVVVYPATFYIEDQPYAEEAILLFYDKKVTLDEIEHEYSKINLIYNRVGMLKTQQQGEEQGEEEVLSNIENAFSHETRKMIHFIKQINKIDALSDELKRLRNNALEYIDLWTKEKKSNARRSPYTPYSIDLLDLCEISKDIGLACKIHSESLNEINIPNLDDKIISRVYLSCTGENVGLLKNPMYIGITDKFHNFKEQIQKSILAGLSNAIFHSLPSKQIGTNEIYEIILVIFNNNGVEIYNRGSYIRGVNSSSKASNTITVMRYQMLDIQNEYKTIKNEIDVNIENAKLEEMRNDNSEKSRFILDFFHDDSNIVKTYIYIPGVFHEWID